MWRLCKDEVSKWNRKSFMEEPAESLQTQRYVPFYDLTAIHRKIVKAV